MSDPAGAEAWNYDALGGVLTDRRTTNSVTKEFTYAYNLDGSVWKITYPTGRTIEYQPNAAGRTDWAKDVANSINYATAASYAPSGALRSVVHGQAAGFAGYTLTQTFNNRLQPNTVVATSPTSTLLDFTYDFVDANGKNNGNVDGILNNRNHNRDQSFTYDELNRIKTAQSAATSGGDCWGLQYGFDIYANLLSATVTKCSETALSVSVDTKNRVTNSGFAYDLSGNATGDGSFSYTWNAESQMKSGAGVNYTYDGDGRRAKKSNGKLYWYGIDAEPLAESDLAGSVSEEYIFFGGKRIARRVVSSSTVFYYFADHLGTSRVIVQANQTTSCYEADNTPYGKERVITDTCPQNYKFTGKERDTESSLDYMGARYYSWGFGRFHSPDLPFIDQHRPNPQSWNLYAYARNNPLVFTDPTGNAVDGPMGGEGLLPGVHHGGAVSLTMLSGATSYSWGWTDISFVLDGQSVQVVAHPQTPSAGDIAAGRFVVEGQRRVQNLFIKIITFGLAMHSYIGIPVVENGAWTGDIQFSEVLGPRKGSGGQEVRRTDALKDNAGNPDAGRHIDGGHDKKVFATAAQREAIRERSQHFASTGQCPVCGSNYSLLRHNSNTFGYNMLSRVGITPPPARRFTPAYKAWGTGWYP